MNLASMLPLPADWDTGDLVVLLAGFAAVVSVSAVWLALVDRDPLAARARQITARRTTLREQITGPRRRQPSAGVGIGIMRGVIRRLDLMKSKQAEQIGARLAQAGIRSKDVVVIYLFAKLCLPLTAGTLVAVWLFVLQGAGEPSTAYLAFPIVAIIVGMLLPDVLVKNAVLKRRKALLMGIPDTLDLLVICVEAGLSLDAALNRVADEIGPSCPELADELSLTAIDLGFQPDRRTALENLVQRTDMPQIRSVVNTLLQSEKFGTPLAQSLRILSNEYRNERMLRAEEKAARLPATMTVPMILFILPSLFIVLLVPAALRTIDGMRGY
jgi:tight adherence protein C